MKNQLTILFLALTWLNTFSYAQNKPDWIENNGVSTTYSDLIYIIGFGAAEDNNIEKRRYAAAQNARADLSSKFRVKIQNEIFILESEVSGFYNNDIRNTVSSQTDFNFVNVDIKYWDDKKKNKMYALAVMEIESSIDYYLDKMMELLISLKTLLNVAKKQIESGNAQQAISYYRKTFPLYVELGEIKAVLHILEGKSPFGELESNDQKPPMSRLEVESVINSLIFEEINSLEASAVSIVEQFRSQWQGDKPLVVKSFTFRDTDFASEFSYQLTNILINKCMAVYNVYTQTNENNSIQGKALLSGTYWLDNEDLKVYSLIVDSYTGEILASASTKIEQDIIKENNFDILPQNSEQAREDSEIFFVQDVVPNPLSLEVWTSKGTNNLIFQENEETEIFVRINKPCYLQVIYHMANGQRLLLYNNLQIDTNDAEQTIKLPDIFYFTPPFGVERLQIFALTKPFDNVRTSSKSVEGVFYDNIFQEDIRSYTNLMRGIKIRKNGDLLAEKTITVTTIAKK